MKAVVSDGVLGLAWRQLSRLPATAGPSLLSTISNRSLLKDNVFTVNFAANVTEPSFVTFGYIPPSLVDRVAYTSLVSSSGRPGFWRVAIAGMRVGSTIVGSCSNSLGSSDDCHAAVDSGTTYLGLPPHLVSCRRRLVRSGWALTMTLYCCELVQRSHCVDALKI